MTGDAVRRCEVFRLPAADPADVGGVMELIASGRVRPNEIRAILGKTEGNGCVNDFTRAYAVSAFQHALAEPLGCTPAEVEQRVAMVMSGGTEGGLSPHFLVFTTAVTDALPRPSLALGSAFTRPFRPEEIGRMPQIKATSEAVIAAMRDAGIARIEDVHYVQVKCPLLTGDRVADAIARGQTVATADTYKSMAYSRGASALGVALGLQELSPALVDDSVVCRRLDLWSGRASSSAGIELMHNEVVVLGNSAGWASDCVIAHRVMRDAIDLPAAIGALTDAGIGVAGQLDDAQNGRVMAVLAKADPSTTGRIRDVRHIMLDDSDINATRHARALVGGVLAGVIGRTDLFVSGGAEHQGPDGGGVVAVIVRQ
jgi:cyanuric acid amidohydrolase